MCCVLKVSDQAGISIEVGCFLAGLAISSRGQSLAKDIREHVEPVRNFLMCYTFSSAGKIIKCDTSIPLSIHIGFHIFPTFLLSEWRMLIIVTLVVVGGKVC